MHDFGRGFRVTPTWTPKVGKIMAFMAVIMGLGLLFYIFFGGLGITHLTPQKYLGSVRVLHSKADG